MKRFFNLVIFTFVIGFSFLVGGFFDVRASWCFRCYKGYCAPKQFSGGCINGCFTDADCRGGGDDGGGDDGGGDDGGGSEGVSCSCSACSPEGTCTTYT